MVDLKVCWRKQSEIGSFAMRKNKKDKDEVFKSQISKSSTINNREGEKTFKWSCNWLREWKENGKSELNYAKLDYKL